MTTTRVLLSKSKKKSQKCPDSAGELHLQLKVVVLIHQLTFLKSTLRNIDWLGLCRLSKLIKNDFFEGSKKGTCNQNQNICSHFWFLGS
jgi:hypothetical protein